MGKIKVTSIETSVKLRNAIGIPETATHYKSGAMAGFIGKSTKSFWTGRQIKEKEQKQFSDDFNILNMNEVKRIFNLEVPDDMKNDVVAFKLAKGLVMCSDIEIPAYMPDELPNQEFEFPINWDEIDFELSQE